MKVRYYILVIFFVAGFCSCTKKFLDVDSTESLFKESYIKNLSAVQEYLNGAFYQLSQRIEQGEVVVAYADLVSDNLKPASAVPNINTTAHYNWVQTVKEPSANPTMNQLWEYGYTTIRMCSFVIDAVDDFSAEDPAKADDLKGQAMALRAFVYFKLINTFAQPYTFTADASHPGVPYITTSDITQSYSRQTVAQVYAGMISDLTHAIQLLPPVAKDIRYMNRNAAKLLLARVYLFKEDYANAKTKALEVSSEVPLLTVAQGYPNDMFKFRPSSNTETLLQVSPTASFTNFLSRYLRVNPVKYVATSDLAAILTEYSDDVRKAWVNNVSGVWMVTKFPMGVAPEIPAVASVPEIAYYPALLRSSEAFLTVAEAAAQTGDENTARTYLHNIRKRANPLIQPVIATGTALLDSIYKERRKEFAYEGLRMYDLQRWKKGVARTDVITGSPATLPYPNEKAISPIPSAEIRLSGLPQNPGY